MKYIKKTLIKISNIEKQNIKQRYIYKKDIKKKCRENSYIKKDI